MKFTYPEGATPIREEELQGLTPQHIRTQRQLNEWEEINIASAVASHFGKLGRFELDEKSLRALHKEMFGKTWKWAGLYRTWNTNIGMDWTMISVEVRKLLDDLNFQLEVSVMPLDDMAIRFHHRLVFIHPFPNGNGRHSRYMADLLLRKYGQEPFSWGSANLTTGGKARQDYIQALQAADQHDYKPLSEFVRS